MTLRSARGPGPVLDQTPDRERGAAAIEFLGVIPALLLAALIALQLGVVGWTISATGEAARAGARAATLGQSADVAAARALPDRFDLEPSPDTILIPVSDGYTYRATVRIPSLIPGLHLPEVTREATMPAIR